MDPAAETPTVAARVFGERAGLAAQYVRLLADEGVVAGVIGPREGPRLWPRHVLGGAVVAEALDPGAVRIADLGSGAGLPGIPLAIARPDLEVHLVEPLRRRTEWLTGVTRELGLSNVVVHTARAEALWGTLRVSAVTARAVAHVGLLAEWSAPLLHDEGCLLAVKGLTAEEELAANARQVQRSGAVATEVLVLGKGVAEPPTRVVRMRFGAAPDITRYAASRAPTSAGSARRRQDRARGTSQRGRRTP